jgi:hypothetical protein
MMIAALALSTFGGWVHNLREFPGMSAAASHLSYAAAQIPLLVIAWRSEPIPGHPAGSGMV